MQEMAQFCYAQARMQARLGVRPDDPVWRRLQGGVDVASYLHNANNTPLQAWIAALPAASNIHDIELGLRNRYRDHVVEISAWLPTRWRAVIGALAQLPDLPALQHLGNGHVPPAWMQDDPGMRAGTGRSPAARTGIPEPAGPAWVGMATQSGTTLPRAWYERWRGLWPRVPRMTAGLEYLGELVLGHIHGIQEEGRDTDMAARREQLLNRLTAAFRRFSFQPAAACAYLGIHALDLERLRADLVDRSLFAGRSEEQP